MIPASDLVSNGPNSDPVHHPPLRFSPFGLYLLIACLDLLFIHSPTSLTTTVQADMVVINDSPIESPWLNYDRNRPGSRNTDFFLRDLEVSMVLSSSLSSAWVCPHTHMDGGRKLFEHTKWRIEDGGFQLPLSKRQTILHLDEIPLDCYSTSSNQSFDRDYGMGQIRFYFPDPNLVTLEVSAVRDDGYVMRTDLLDTRHTTGPGGGFGYTFQFPLLFNTEIHLIVNQAPIVYQPNFGVTGIRKRRQVQQHVFLLSSPYYTHHVHADGCDHEPTPTVEIFQCPLGIDQYPIPIGDAIAKRESVWGKNCHNTTDQIRYCMKPGASICLELSIPAIPSEFLNTYVHLSSTMNHTLTDYIRQPRLYAMKEQFHNTTHKFWRGWIDLPQLLRFYRNQQQHPRTTGSISPPLTRYPLSDNLILIKIDYLSYPHAYRKSNSFSVPFQISSEPTPDSEDSVLPDSVDKDEDSDDYEATQTTMANAESKGSKFPTVPVEESSNQNQSIEADESVMVLPDFHHPPPLNIPPSTTRLDALTSNHLRTDDRPSSSIESILNHDLIQVNHDELAMDSMSGWITSTTITWFMGIFSSLLMIIIICWIRFNRGSRTDNHAEYNPLRRLGGYSRSQSIHANHAPELPY